MNFNRNFVLCTNLAGEGGGQHAGEELERHGEQKLHEGDEDENWEGNQSKQVGHRANKLPENALHSQIRYLK